MVKNIAVLTAGGDAPGMNAAIRAVVRASIYNHLRIFGVKRGFRGLIDGDILEMDLTSVSGIINRGGTILKTIRCPEFKDKKNQRQAVLHLQSFDIDAVVVIGGNGSLAGGGALYYKWGIPVISIPASIDNDLSFTDYTVGFDTAVNTALEAIDKIRDTATSHDRVFVVEVMGRDNGFIALEVALGCGAEAVIVPEIKTSMDKLCENLIQGEHRGKKSSIIIVAEGAAKGHDIAEIVAEKCGLEVRVSILGYMQRGGTPTAFSRMLAARMGKAAVDSLLAGKFGKMIGNRGMDIIATDIKKVLACKKKIDLSDYKLVSILSI
jgi:6-phosphofructokinase 1